MLREARLPNGCLTSARLWSCSATRIPTRASTSGFIDAIETSTCDALSTCSSRDRSIRCLKKPTGSPEACSEWIRCPPGWRRLRSAPASPACRCGSCSPRRTTGRPTRRVKTSPRSLISSGITGSLRPRRRSRARLSCCSTISSRRANCRFACRTRRGSKCPQIRESGGRVVTSGSSSSAEHHRRRCRFSSRLRSRGSARPGGFKPCANLPTLRADGTAKWP
jgi:hypothetical protein